MIDKRRSPTGCAQTNAPRHLGPFAVETDSSEAMPQLTRADSQRSQMEACSFGGDNQIYVICI